MNTFKINVNYLYGTSILLLSALGVLLFLLYSQNTYKNRQFSEQAHSFIQGKLDIPQAADTVPFEGKHYWHPPPFPSLLLIPGQLVVGKQFNEPIAQGLLIIISGILVYLLSRHHNLNKLDSIFIVFAFFFGSMMIRLMLVPSSWYFAQIVAVTLLLLSLYEYFHQRRYIVLGILLSCIIATRPTAASFILVVVWQIIRDKNDLLTKVASFIKLGIPIGITGCLLLLFNYARFHTININPYDLSTVHPMLESMRADGVFSISHLLPNVYYYFFAIPELVLNNSTRSITFPFITFNPFGMSIFLVAPFFLYSLRSLTKKYQKERLYWSAIAATCFILFIYFSRGGFLTYGPRYIADVLPLFLVLVLKTQTKPLTSFQKTLILVSASFNFYLIISYIVLPVLDARVNYLVF